MRKKAIALGSASLALLVVPSAANACRNYGEETLTYTSKEPIANLPAGTKQYRVKVLPPTKDRELYSAAFLQVYQPDEPRSGENALTIQLPLEHTSCQAVEPIAQEGTFYVAGYSVLAEEGKPNRMLGNIHIKLALLSKRDGW